jgi:hypothetical protein
MNKPTPRRPLLLALLLSAFSLVGCLGDDAIEPIYEVPDDEYVVVFPAREGSSESAWSSTIGHRIAEATTRRLEAKADFLTVPYGEVIELMYAEPNANARKGNDNEAGLDVRAITPEKLAELTGADWVIVIDVLHFQEKDPKNINMTRASGSADVKLFKLAKSSGEKKKARTSSERRRKRDAARKAHDLKPLGETPDGGKWVASKSVSASYPKDFFGTYGESFLDPVEARKGLIEEIGDKVSKCFYEHEKETMPGSGN